MLANTKAQKQKREDRTLDPNTQDSFETASFISREKKTYETS